MEEVKKTITESFGESIQENLKDVSVDTAEVLLDSITDNELLKDIPIIKYVVSTYKIVDDIKGRFFLQKMCNFINNFNAGTLEEKDIEEQRSKFVGKNRDEELAYITIIIDKYLDIEKPKILAKLYLAYLDEKISWIEFCSYAEITDNLLKIDIQYFLQYREFTTKNNIIDAELLRLTSMGLMSSYQNDSPFRDDGHGGMAIYAGDIDRVKSKEKIFFRTKFGEKFAEIIE